MQETWVQSPGWEDPLEKEMATHSSILAWRSPWMEKPGDPSPWGHKELDTTERLYFHFLYLLVEALSLCHLFHPTSKICQISLKMLSTQIYTVIKLEP